MTGCEAEATLTSERAGAKGVGKGWVWDRSVVITIYNCITNYVFYIISHHAPWWGRGCTAKDTLDRLSGVWTPLEWADSAPVWLGDAGALLGQEKKEG